MAMSVKKICVVRIGAMGDILLTTPTLRALARHYPGAQMDIIVGRDMGPVVSGLPYIHDIMEFGPRGDDTRFGPYMRFVGQVRSRGYDLFVNLQPSVKNIYLMLASGARKSVTYTKDMRVQRDTGHVRHAIDDYLKTLRPLGITNVRDRHMDFYVPDEARLAVDTLLAAEGIRPNEPVFMVNPGGTREINRWPPVRFSALLDRAAREMPHLRLVLSGGRGDLERAKVIMEGIGAGTRVVNVAGRLSIKEMGAMLQRTQAFVTADTGPLHIASAVGTPIVCLSGAADPDRTGPIGDPNDLIVIRRDLGCVPCRARRECARKDIACMTGMEVDWVFEAVRRRLGLVHPLPMAGSGTGTVEKYPIEEVGTLAVAPRSEKP